MDIRKLTALLLLIILAMGCARAGLGADDIEPPESKAVVVYVPRSSEEALAQAALAVADVAARKALDDFKQRMEYVKNGLTAEGPPPSPAERTREAGFARIEREETAMQAAHMAHVDRYEKFLLRYPHNWYVRHRYADFLVDQGFSFEASEEWRKVIEMEPRFPYAYNNLGTLYNHMGRDLEAIILFRKAIELKDDDATFHVNLATNYFTHRYETMEEFGWDLPRTFKECMDSYRRAIALEPKNRDLVFEYATTYVMAHHFQVEDTADEEIEAWRYYLTLEMTDYQRGIGLRNLGGVLMRKKRDPAAAAEVFREAVELMPDDPGVRTLLAQAEEMMKADAPAGGRKE
jgi:tetratricopeptide (TPR) repeat protein